MPRLFSLKHPLTEMCPILIKTPNSVTYIVEAEYKVIFSSPDSDLILMFDQRSGRHFVCRLRDATADEIHKVAPTDASINYSSHMHSMTMTGNSFNIRSGTLQKNLSNMQKSVYNISTSPVSHPSNTSAFSPSSPASPLQRLQTSMGHLMTTQDFRKMEQVAPSKPIVPELCLDVIWTDNAGSRDFNEQASHGFIHTDLIGQTYLCYLLPHTYKLNMAKMEKSHTPTTQVFGMVSSITAKSAVNLSVSTIALLKTYIVQHLNKSTTFHLLGES